MHWSRLVDAGLAGLLMVFQVFTDHADAERLMRAWWPLLWLLPTMAGMVAIAWRIAGREAALVALLLALVGVPAYQQFTPGRIDHHNVQIALTFLAVAATVWSDRVRWAAAAAGALSGFALAIGFECLPYLAACGVALALRYIADRYAAPALIAYGLSLAASMLIAFGVDVAPANWARTACDAIAINSAAGAVCGGLVLALVGLLAHPHRVTRIAAVLGAGVAAAAVVLLLEPRCAGGPIALVDPAIWPIWLSDVREMQPLLSVWRTNPLTAAAIATFPAAALLAVLILAGERALRRDFGFLTAGLVFLVAAATMVGAIRAFSYAMWFGMPLVAVLGVRLFARYGAQELCRPAGGGTGPHPDGALVGGDHHRRCRGPQRHGRLFPAGQPRLRRDRELRTAAPAEPRAGGDGHQLRTVPAGADHAFGSRRALSPAFERDRNRPPRPGRAARRGPWGAARCSGRLRRDLRAAAARRTAGAGAQPQPVGPVAGGRRARLA